MSRYFFDVSANDTVQYDYTGRIMRSDEAQNYAELIALDLGCTQLNAYPKAEVQVRDITGRQLFAVSVQLPDAIAA